MFKMATEVGGTISAAGPLVKFNLQALGAYGTIYYGLNSKLNVPIRVRPIVPSLRERAPAL